jgi:hypothetical protein
MGLNNVKTEIVTTLFVLWQPQSLAQFFEAAFQSGTRA